jgi:hypothetical protein
MTNPNPNLRRSNPKIEKRKNAMSPRTTAVSVPAVSAVSIPTVVSAVWPKSREEAILASRAVVAERERTYGTTASRMCLDPQGLMSAFARELLSAYCDVDGVVIQYDAETQKNDIAISRVGFKLATMLHQRLQNQGLVTGDTKQPLSIHYVWRDIAPNQVGVIQSFLIELDGVAKTRPSSLMRTGVRYWQSRYRDLFTSELNSTADHSELLDELDF